jgi:hypothetical protein
MPELDPCEISTEILMPDGESFEVYCKRETRHGSITMLSP